MEKGFEVDCKNVDDDVHYSDETSCWVYILCCLSFLLNNKLIRIITPRNNRNEHDNEAEHFNCPKLRIFFKTIQATVDPVDL